MFDPTPGKVQSNFNVIQGGEQDMFGFFYATQQDTQQVFIDLTFVGSPDTICPVIIPFVTLKATQDNPDGEPCFCYDCTVLDLPGQDVSIFRPDFWNENLQ